MSEQNWLTAETAARRLGSMSSPCNFQSFKTWPDNIRLAVMMYVRYPLSLWNVEHPLNQRGIAITHETGRFW